MTVSLVEQVKNLSKQVEDTDPNGPPKAPRKKVQVYCRCIFDRIIDIDTKGEKYDADVIIETSWLNDEILKVLASPKFKPDYRSTLIEQRQQSEKLLDTHLRNILTNIEDFRYESRLFWSPDLFIVNAVNIKEEIRYNVRIVEKTSHSLRDIKSSSLVNQNREQATSFVDSLSVLITEIRKVRGLFYEKLELNDFPIDTQELSVTLSSNKSVDEVELVEDKSKINIVNTERFYDQQQWNLFSFCEASNDECFDEMKDLTRSEIKFTSFVSRKYQFYVYNAYILLVLITAISLTTFSVLLKGPQDRLSIVGVLLLTSVNFRWIITQRLPSVSYLTFLDKFAIGCIFLIALVFSWDSVIGNYAQLFPERLSTFVQVEQYVLWGIGSGFGLFVLLVTLSFVRMNMKLRKFDSENTKKYLNLKQVKNEFAKTISESQF